MQSLPAIYVLGHKNPDSDAICSAIGFTALLHAQGRANAVAARQGVLRPETAYILERFGVPVPLLVTDVRPRVADVMTTPALSVHEETSLYEVGQMLQGDGVRAVSVVNDQGRLCGIIGIEDFARSFISGLDLDQLDHVPLSLDNVLRALGGRLLVDAPQRTLRDRAMVGAMEIDTMLKRIAPDILLVMGDREDAQKAAIEFGVGALVITGDTPVSEEILELAREHQVTVISVAHHTYTTVRLIHMSTAIRHVMRREVITCEPDDLVDEVRETLQAGRVRALVVVDENRKVLGIISRTSLLRRRMRRQLVLVDHNERSQSVAGIEEADVIGVIDHHRVADFQTRSPAFMRMEPVGATSTIVAKLFAEANIPIPQPIAGLLLSGILTDTLLFRGPTTTPEDQRVAGILAERAGLDINELGAHILSLVSDVSDRSPDQIVMSDFKEFRVEDCHFGLGVFETADGEEVLSRRTELLDSMTRLQDQGYTSVLFAVIDIIRENTTILAVGHAEAVAETFGATLEEGHSIRLPGILSRKKHIVPLLTNLAQRIGSVAYRG